MREWRATMEGMKRRGSRRGGGGMHEKEERKVRAVGEKEGERKRARG